MPRVVGPEAERSKRRLWPLPVFGAAILVAIGASVTHGEHWEFTRNDEDVVNGVSLLRGTEGNETGNIANIFELQSHLRESGPWCSGLDLLLGDSNHAKVCIDEASITVTPSDNRVFAVMRTEPRVEQTEGNPSLFMTFQQESLLPLCIEARDEMKAALEEEMSSQLGNAAENLVIDLHVDRRNLTHPCDDPMPGA